MDEFLLGLFTLSLGGSVLVLAIMGLSRLTRSRYAARWRCVVWLLLCLRLAVPLVFTFPHTTPVQIPAPALDRPVAATAPPSSQPLPTLPEEAQDQTQSLSIAQVLCVVWAVGVGGVFLWSVGSHLRLRRYLKRWSIPVSDQVICNRYHAQAQRCNANRVPPLVHCPGLQVPMLAGVVHPVLMLPEHVEANQMLDYALLHELIHYRRKDICLKVVAIWAAAIHWFNPLVWLMVRQVEQDMELACDEAALTVLPPQEHRAYGETILRAAAQKASH
ncbi:M56 family metallopeptidase [Pseudoflavonifractor sp. An85]|uniref:M56 family metallopeptidase n=1 Tax=Pseudoflavonifractor sp. An85 TaxID=1965661 RepID=UPI0013025F18|nr:M56 family metallopeptidase [Pseudoflavonifractor sp. An85]